MDKAIKQLFKRYEQGFSALDMRSVADTFSDAFLAAGPKGTIAHSKEEFLGMADKAADFYRGVGQKEARILAMSETPISPEYTLVKIHWGATFEKTGARFIEFDVSYVVQKTGTEPSIILTVSHEDEEKAMQELGLLEAAQAA